MGQTVESDSGVQIWPGTVVVGTQGPLKPSHPSLSQTDSDATPQSTACIREIQILFLQRTW